MRSTWILDEQPFAIVVDCGSSGSRLHMYKYDLGKAKWLVVEPAKESAGKFKNKMKIADELGKNQRTHEIVTVVSEFIFLAQPYIPEASRDSIHVWLILTAGVRRKYKEYQDKVKQIYLEERESKENPNYQLVRKNVAGLGNMFERVLKVERLLKVTLAKQRYMLENLTVVSGEEEAVFAWIATNEVLGNPDLSVGIIEMGGASAQVCFESPEVNIAGYFPIYKKRRLTSLHASSFNSYGLDVAYEEQVAEWRTVNIQTHSGAREDHFDDPCMAKGYHEIREPNTEVVGNYDFNKCKDLIRQERNCKFPPCYLKNIWVPEVSRRAPNIYYIRGYPEKVAAELGLKPNTDFSNGQFKERIKKFCDLTKEQANKSHHTWIDLPHMCYKSLFVTQFLEDIGFRDEDECFRYLDSQQASLAYGSLIYNTVDMVSWLPPFQVGKTTADGVLTQIAVPMAILNVILVFVLMVCCCTIVR